MHSSRLTFIALAAGLLVASCGGGSDNNGFSFAPIAQVPPAPPAPPAPPPPAVAPPPAPEETRLQDSRTSFAPADPSATTFTALAADAGDTVDNSTTSRWAGMLGGAQYQVEVPEELERRAGDVRARLCGRRQPARKPAPSIRRYLIQKGYAWAASSYSKNFYDVRAGVEDTNALALQFSAIAKANGRDLAAPAKTFITGHSMGGHITAAAIEDETYATANHKVKYNGAVPMCGVVGDTELFDYFAAAQVAAQALAGLPKLPDAELGGHCGFKWWSAVHELHDIAANIAPRRSVPSTRRCCRTSPAARARCSTWASSGWLVRRRVGRVRQRRHRQRHPEQEHAGHQPLHLQDRRRRCRLRRAQRSVRRSSRPLPDANRLRTDGLRWIPKSNGEFKIPVVTLHTLGDLYVPFSMEQIYNKRVAAKGNSDWLVQRAIRGITHCDFTIKEQEEAFDDMIAWERTRQRSRWATTWSHRPWSRPRTTAASSRETAGARTTARRARQRAPPQLRCRSDAAGGRRI
jgi:alpha-beta hydrolase superfamily lysophospholipase